MAPSPLSVSASRVMPADATTLYRLISDITMMPRFSPETVRTRWLDGATAAEVGARFQGFNRLGGLRWSTKPTITVAIPGRAFAFQVNGTGGPLWSYLFEAVDGGTRVTETARQTELSPAFIRFMQRRAGAVDRAEHLRVGMVTTLDRLAAAVTARPVALPVSTVS